MSFNQNCSQSYSTTNFIFLVFRAVILEVATLGWFRTWELNRVEWFSTLFYIALSFLLFMTGQVFEHWLLNLLFYLSLPGPQSTQLSVLAFGFLCRTQLTPQTDNRGWKHINPCPVQSTGWDCNLIPLALLLFQNTFFKKFQFPIFILLPAKRSVQTPPSPGLRPQG